ncbi:MAG: hypothetical protein D6E12_18725 [Desulfovibrio sp.]|nr:MAG: hypothetical protein D6E12_18725 [Desulfovibrio sp.]
MTYVWLSVFAVVTSCMWSAYILSKGCTYAQAVVFFVTGVVFIVVSGLLYKLCRVTVWAGALVGLCFWVRFVLLNDSLGLLSWLFEVV